MTTYAVSTAQLSDQDRVVDTIVLAFARDPFARWVFPEPYQYLAHSGTMTRAFGGRAFDHGSAHQVGGFAGAALWLPPGVEPDEETLFGVVESSVAPQRRRTLLATLEQMSGCRPTEPHWYLPLIGVDPAQQGCGYGTELLRHALERVDREGTAAYLENTNPANTPLYERHGFKVIGTVQVGDAPPMIPMLRGGQVRHADAT